MFLLPLITLLASCVTAAPMLYLVGDSTMATQTAPGAITQGWGAILPQFLDGLTVINKAILGASVRSYTRERRWKDYENLIKPGDFLVLEFGHNDSGPGDAATRNRSCVVGEGDETINVTLDDGTHEVVHTWPYYVKSMIDRFQSHGVTVILSSTTPTDPYESSDTIDFTPTRFVTYAKNTAAAKGIPYVDHFKACLLLYQKVGKKTTRSYFAQPGDPTHTGPAGAKAVAQAFLSGVDSDAPSIKKAWSSYRKDE